MAMLKNYFLKFTTVAAFCVLGLSVLNCRVRSSQIKEVGPSLENSNIICDPDKVCLDLSDNSPKEPLKPFDKTFDKLVRDRFQAILKNQTEDSTRPLPPGDQEFLTENGLSENFLAFKNTNAFFQPFLKLLFDKEFQESKSRDKLRDFARHMTNRISHQTSPKILDKEASDLLISDQPENLQKLDLLPLNFNKIRSLFNKIIPSLALIMTISMAGFLGVMNAQCLGIMEQNIGTPIEFVQYEESFNPKTQFEMFFFDCAANDVDCIHMAVRLDKTIYHGGGPIAGTSLFTLPLPEAAPLRNWNGMAKVFSTSYEDFKNANGGLNSNHSLTSVRLQLPEWEIQNLTKYYGSKVGQFYNYWAFPPVSTCTTVARDAIEANTSVKLPPVVQDFPGANEAYLKLSKLFGDKRIVSIVRNQGRNDAFSTPRQIMAKRALHLGAQSAALITTLPATILEEMGGNQMHFTPGEVFDFRQLYFGQVAGKEAESSE